MCASAVGRVRDRVAWTPASGQGPEPAEEETCVRLPTTQEGRPFPECSRIVHAGGAARRALRYAPARRAQARVRRAPAPSLGSDLRRNDPAGLNSAVTVFPLRVWYTARTTPWRRSRRMRGCVPLQR